MNMIKFHRKAARARVNASGNSHQAELNAIARENGHAAWGSFQAALKAAMTAEDNAFSKADLIGPDDEAIEIAALADAFESAKKDGGHLVILRATHALELEAIALLAGPKGAAQAHRLDGASFAETLTHENVAEAYAAGLTLVAGSAGMQCRATTGNFVVTNPDQPLWEGAALYSKRDQQIIYATTAVNYVLPQNGGETVEMLRGKVGATTIRKVSRSVSRNTVFQSVDVGDVDIRFDWNKPINQRDDDWHRTPFVPAFNVLLPKFLPDGDDALERHVERIADILIPESVNDYFDTKGRQALLGFLLVEVGRAKKDGRTPSIPALVDWINAGLRAASDDNERRRSRAKDFASYRAINALSDWLRTVVTECREHGYHRRAAAEIMPLASMAPNELSGILGTMDKGLLPFKNAQVREANS